MPRQRKTIKYLAGAILVALIISSILILRGWHYRHSEMKVFNYARGPKDAPIVIKEFSDYQ